MTKSSATFLSYNSTGMNTIKSRWIRDLICVTESSFVQIQEHFKISKSIDQFFSDQFPSHISYVTPGQRDKHQDYGRASGGLAQLSKSSVDIRQTRLKCSNYRLQA